MAVTSVSLYQRQVTIQRCVSHNHNSASATFKRVAYVTCVLLPAVPCLLILGHLKAIITAQWAE